MKQITKTLLYICILICCIACEQPSFHFSNLHSAVMEQGDSLLLHLRGMGGIHYQVASMDSICTVVPTNKDGSEATIYALCPGWDTIDIFGVSGLSVHSNMERVHILVLEKDTITKN